MQSIPISGKIQSFLRTRRIRTNLAWAVKCIPLSICSETLHTTDTWPSTQKISSRADDFHRLAKYSLASDDISKEPKLHRQVNNQWCLYRSHFWRSCLSVYLLAGWFNKWSKNSDDSPHRRGIFHWENLMWNITASVAGQSECWSTAGGEIPTYGPLEMVLGGVRTNLDVIPLKSAPSVGRFESPSNT